MPGLSPYVYDQDQHDEIVRKKITFCKLFFLKD